MIGAGGNTFSTIRPQIGGRQLIVKKQNGLLNGIDPTPIIVVQKTGKFGKLIFKIIKVKTDLFHKMELSKLLSRHLLGPYYHIRIQSH